MKVSKAEATWTGNLKEGHGDMKLASGPFNGSYSFGTRFGEEGGTNPEELIGAAHAACYSMALSASLEKAGFTPQRIHTAASVSLDKADGGFKITNILLQTEVSASGVDDATFQQIAAKTKEECPVSKALAATDISLEAKLV